MQRPAGVTILAVLAFLIGGLLLLGGVVALLGERYLPIWLQAAALECWRGSEAPSLALCSLVLP